MVVNPLRGRLLIQITLMVLPHAGRRVDIPVSAAQLTGDNSVAVSQYSS